MYNIILWRVRVTIVYTEMQQFFPLCSRWPTCCCRQYSVHCCHDMQQWALFALLLGYKISRRGVNSIQVLTSSCVVPDILVRFNRIYSVVTDFRKCYQYQIPRKCIPWDPCWYMMAGGPMDRCGEANGRFTWLMGRRLRSPLVCGTLYFYEILYCNRSSTRLFWHTRNLQEISMLQITDISSFRPSRRWSELSEKKI